MSSPYRDVLETVEAESMPVFRAVERSRLAVGVFTAVILIVGLADWLRGRHDDAVAFVAFHLPAVPVVALILFLEKPVRAWLERRYARKVARGIVELEARAARIASDHET